MKKRNETVHLLILDQSQNDAESMVSLLRNSGRATRAHRVTSREDLQEHLSDHLWDLFLAREQNAEFDARAALAEIKRLDKDIPFIVLTEDYDKEQIPELLKLGAQDAIPFEYKNHLVHAINRELKNLNERRLRRSADIHLYEAEKRCELLLDSSKDAIAYVNDGMHVYANQSYLDFFDYEDMDEMMCIPILDTLTKDSQEKYKELSRRVINNHEEAHYDAVARRSDDSELDVTINLSPATYDGEPCTQIIVRPQENDIELVSKLKEMSSQDLLTGLYNRQYLMEQLNHTVESVHKEQTEAAILYISVDQFQTIKSDIGIAGTDLVLSDLATLLSNSISEEKCVVARMGDESFAVLLTSSDDKAAMKVAEAVRSAVAEHLFEVSERTIQLTVSIGITLINESSPKPNDVMGRALKAASDVKKLEGHAKGNGINLFVVQQEINNSMTSVSILQKALDSNRFKTLFQPIISLRGEGEEHYEALLRMLDSNDEEVSPYDFLPPTGPSEIASKIDRWVTLQTIKSLSAHRSKGNQTRLFLNVTAETVVDPTFLQWLSVALKAARLPGDSLIFQMTENDAINHLKQAKAFTKAIKELHCKMSISRFGCSLDPFNTLKHVDADYVKLDGSFTEEIQQNEDTRKQIKEMIQQLQTMGKLTIVPLVENAAVLSTLWQAGVNYIQGYYLQAPASEMNYDFSEE
ncbi:MAG: diguanylate cyclase [Gammaproteobacteria bacterium]|nr:MAG: diguanylate cyclase [Gammaproteobacteria bacterium]